MIQTSELSAGHTADWARVPRAAGLRRAKHLHVAGALLPILWQEGGALAVLRRLALGAAARVSLPCILDLNLTWQANPPPCK